MLTKQKTVFSCQNCAAEYPQWHGQCKQCQAWNSLQEESKQAVSVKRQGYAGDPSQLQRLAEVAVTPTLRMSTGVSEFDHVLGGGLVSDSVILIGGDPGIGKSTLLLQVTGSLAENHSVLYVTGEESGQQVAMRAKRLGIENMDLPLLTETRVEAILAQAKTFKPQVIVIDSVQTMWTESVASAPGSVSQVRESAAQLVQYAKMHGVALFLVGHVTKEGAIAGPRVLEHMVDAVLYFEGGSDQRYRVIRAVKNRFGAVNEIGIFAMTDKGLKQVSNPSAIFLSKEIKTMPGSVIMVTWEGSRPLLVEVQALVDTSHLGNPRRVTVGLDQNRLSMLLAILHRHGGVATYDQDVFVNVVGGLRVLETGVDLALLMAVRSSLTNQAIPSDQIVFGEVGLAGELRPVTGGLERIKEAAKHGFKRAIVPAANAPKKPIPGMEVIAASHLSGVLG